MKCHSKISVYNGEEICFPPVFCIRRVWNISLVYHEMLMLYTHIREICTTVNPGGPGSFHQQLRWPVTAHLCWLVCVAGVVVGVNNGRLMKVREFIEMVHQAAVQLMLQLRDKDSPAVLWISLCAYAIRIHGTAVRPGASDPKMRWQENRQRVNTEHPESDRDSLGPADIKQTCCLLWE